MQCLSLLSVKCEEKVGAPNIVNILRNSLTALVRGGGNLYIIASSM